MRLLLVEDDLMIGEQLLELLRAESYAVDWVRDGEIADTALQSQTYDLVLLDLGLPKRDGMSVLQALRARKQARVAGLDAGADDYVLKPFDFDELLARIRALLGPRRRPLRAHLRAHGREHQSRHPRGDVERPSGDAVGARMGRAGAPAGAAGHGAVARAARGEALQLEGRDQQQRGRGLHPRAAQETGRGADPERSERLPQRAHGDRRDLRLPDAAGGALSLRAGMGTGLPLTLGEEQSIDLIVQVWGLDGTPLYRSAGPDWLPQRAVLGFSNVALRGKRYRVFAVQGRFQVVQVAQDIAVRQRMAGQLAWRTVLPTALMLPLLALVVWWVVSHSLAPLERVRQQLSRRVAQDLAPVDEADVPSEVQPLVSELNSLLARVGHRSGFSSDRAAARAGSSGQREDAGAGAGDRAGSALPKCGRGRRHAGACARHRPGLGRCDEVRVDGHPEALTMLLRNLLDNGIKYGRSRVDLSLERSGGQALLVVEDDGPGFPDAERGRVFDRFYRSESQAQQAPGSGLGLALVRSIAQDHGATLRLGHSTALGGLRVEMALPLGSMPGRAQLAPPRL
ncbi:response regulator receiver domain-containing protein [Ditylenchus destructor]|nr:response regulator receiver domain-containing protein [Ditylenchus destructor]